MKYCVICDSKRTYAVAVDTVASAVDTKNTAIVSVAKTDYTATKADV